MTTDQAEIEPVLAGALSLLREKPEADLETLAAKVAAAVAAPLHAEAEPFPALPQHTEPSEEFKRAIKQLLAVLNSVEVQTRRSLTQTEIDLLTLEESVISLIAATLKARDASLRETIRHHMDVAAEEAGIAVAKDKLGPDGQVIVAATPRDQNGHYLLAGPQQPHQVQAGPVSWSQEYSASAPVASQIVLDELLAKGEIERPYYMAITRAERVLDTDKLRAFIRKHPLTGLKILRKITVAGKPKASLYLRKQT